MQIACLRGFTDAEVYAARDLLFIAYANQLGPIQKRQDSPNRTRVQAVMEDLLAAFKELDKMNTQPLCVTNDLKKIPKNSPEEVDVVCLLEKLRLLENRVYNVETSQQFISDTFDTHSAKVNDVDNNLRKIKNDTDTALQLAKETHIVISNNKSNYVNVAKHNNKNSLSGRRNSSVGNDSNNYGRSNSSQRGSGHVNHGTASTGTKPTSRLGAPPPSRYLVIAKILQGKTVDDVSSYIKEMDSSIDIRSLMPISHEGAPFQKFKLELSGSDFYKVNNRNFWESGVYCYPFRGQWHRDPNNSSE